MNIGSTTGSTLTVAATGVAQADKSVQQAAQQVVESTTARPAQGTVEATEGLLKLRQGERQVEANVQVLETADETLGTLIDLKA